MFMQTKEFGLRRLDSDPFIICVGLLDNHKVGNEGVGVWQAFDNGATTGQRGPEGGVIVRDEEHKSGARATLERDCGSAPWTVTCGVYGWFFHTRFLGSEEAAEFHSMLNGLAAILDHIPSADDPEADSKVSVVCEAIERFVARFP
ncbi:MAG TPA: hypothetical protein VEI07_18050 [Planctomycetaceae bacterium]|nr:hypothetical protein [Planctomycetaceae bacterium]